MLYRNGHTAFAARGLEGLGPRSYRAPFTKSSQLMNLGLSLKSFAVHKQRFKLINELEVKLIIFNMADLLLCAKMFTVVF